MAKTNGYGAPTGAPESQPKNTDGAPIAPDAPIAPEAPAFAVDHTYSNALRLAAPGLRAFGNQKGEGRTLLMKERAAIGAGKQRVSAQSIAKQAAGLVEVIRNFEDELAKENLTLKDVALSTA